MPTADPTPSHPAEGPSHQESVPASAPARGSHTAAVGDRAARGVVWLLALSIVDKVGQTVTQLALAWLLLPEHFGLVAMVYSVTTFAALFQQAGIKNVLIREIDRLPEYATPAFWLSLTLGLAAGGLVAGISPLVAAFYSDPRVIPLILVSALSLPLASLMTLPEALLGGRMRFSTLGVLGSSMLLLTGVLSITFAAMGLGALSIILPFPIVALVRLIILWRIAPVPFRLRPEFARWKLVLMPSTLVLASSLAMMVTYVGHNAVLARLTNAELAGLMGTAYNLSDQVTRALMLNLAGVLLPALSVLAADPLRQGAGFLRAIRALLLVGVPFCFLQAAVAVPGFRLALPERWEPAIPMFIIFSVAMLGRLVLSPCESMIQAQGKFALWLRIAICYAVGFLTCTIGATLLFREHSDALSEFLGFRVGAGEGCALGVAVALNVVAPVATSLALRRAGMGLREVWLAYRFPILASTAAAVPAVLVVRAFPATHTGDAGALAAGSIVMAVVYLGLARQFAHQDLYDLLSRLRRIMPGRVRRWFEARAARKGLTPTDTD